MTNSLANEICEAITNCLCGDTNYFEVVTEHFLPNHLGGDNTFTACKFFYEIREGGCSLQESDRQKLIETIAAIRNKLDQITDDDKQICNAVCEVFGIGHPYQTQRRVLARQILHRLAGYLYVWLVAEQFPRYENISTAKVDDGWIQDLDQLAFHIDQTWMYPYRSATESGNGLSQNGRVAKALSHAIDKGLLENGWRFDHLMTRLVVRRILRYLLGEEDVTSVEQQSPPTVDVLTVVRRMDKLLDEQAGGAMRKLALHIDQEGFTGWYFDPITWGIVAFDKDMQQAVELAGRLSFDSLRDKHTGKAIRLLPYPSGRPPGAIHGNSAGGLVACAMYGFSTGKQLTSDITASVGLKRRQGVRLTNTQTITANDIKLVPVGGAVPKLPPRPRAGCKRSRFTRETKMKPIDTS